MKRTPSNSDKETHHGSVGNSAIGIFVDARFWSFACVSAQSEVGLRSQRQPRHRPAHRAGAGDHILTQYHALLSH